MKHILTTIMIFFIAGIASSGEFDRTFDAGYGKTVSINVRTGGILQINGWDKEKVSVHITSRMDSMDEDFVSIQKRSSGLEIDVRYDNFNNLGLKMVVNVPKKQNLEVENMGGEISISDVEGEISGKTMGGSLTFRKLKGQLNMTTMGGNIRLYDSEVDGQLKTMGGEVYFDNVYGGINGSTMGGDVTYRNVFDKDGRPKTKGSEVSISTMGGDINVDEALQGANVHTMGGRIHIKKAAQFVKAKTMGGSIMIDEIDGWVEATTMGGDIDVNMVGDANKGKRDVSLSSMGGHIGLTLPENISAQFDILLTYTKNSRRDYSIESDFDLTIKESDDWIQKHGSPRKEIKGSGKTGDGKNRIKIDTINGNIVLKKGK